jgi:hypothetical protein
MNAIFKLILTLGLFLATWLCIYGYQAQELVKISTPWSAVISLMCAATFVYFAFVDIKRQ